MADKRQALSVEWWCFGVRWLLLLAVFATVQLTPELNRNPDFFYPILIVGVSYELVIALMLTFRFFPLSLVLISQLLDVIGLLALFYVSGQGQSPLLVLAVLPVAAGGARLGRALSLTTAVALACGEGLLLLLTYNNAMPPTVLASFVLTTAAFLGVAALFRHGESFPAELRRPARRDALSRGSDEALQARAALERLQTVYKLASTLSATLSYDRVLEALLDISAMGFQEIDGFAPNSPRMVLLFHTKDQLTVVASRHLTAEDAARTLPGVTGFVSEAMTAAEPTIGGSVARDPELQAFASLAEAQSVLCVPLRAGFESYGAVLFTSSKPQAFSQEHVELIGAFCNQAVIALQNARLYRSLQEEKQRIVDTQEEARRRLARELHDGPTQSVSAIAMRLNFTKLLAKREPAKAAAELEKLEELARRTAKEIRMMLFTLRPVVLETQGLAPALQQYADKMRETEGLPVTIDSDIEDRLPAKVEDIAFSVIEEAVNNARKHARAKSVSVRLRQQRGLFVAEIQDDGRGFDVSSVTKSYDQRGSLGLINMRERAGLLDGNVTIDSTPGQGTTVTLVVPLSSELS
jgi:signal transduction histidine kinase